MPEESKNIIVKLKDVRLSFPELAKAIPYKKTPDGPKSYHATFLVRKEDPQIKMIEDAILKVAKAAWGVKAETMLKKFRGDKQTFCFLDGDNKAETDGYAGCWALASKLAEIDKKTNALQKPFILNRAREDIKLGEIGAPYGGAYVNGSVEIWAQTGDYPGIRCKLRGVQFLKDGPRFSGAVPVSVDEFEDLSTDDDMEGLM